MATRNRNRTQRKNKNRSRRNRQGGGAASAMSCAEARTLAVSGTGVKKIMAQTKLRAECKGNNTENVSGTVAPNQKWSSMAM